MVYQSNTTEQNQRREGEGLIFIPETEQRNQSKTEEAEERRRGLIHENQKSTEGFFQETMAFSFPRRKTSSSVRPKLQRTNALKLTDFELFSPSPSSSSSSSSLLQNGPWSPLVVVSFYKFAHLPDFEAKRPPLKDLCEELVILTLQSTIESINVVILVPCICCFSTLMLL